MLVDCPQCHAHVDADLKGELQYGPGDNYDPGRYALLQCRRCASALLVNQDNNGNMAEGDIWGNRPFFSRSPIFALIRKRRPISVPQLKKALDVTGRVHLRLLRSCAAKRS